MSVQIASVLILTFVIHLVATLSYAARLVGVRTGRIAVSFSLFNILVLVSRTANSLQQPLLSKRVENDLASAAGVAQASAALFRWVLLAAALATAAGALLLPSFQRLFTRAVQSFSLHRSVPRLLLHTFSKGGIQHLRDSLVVPSPRHVAVLRGRVLPIRIMLYNTVVVAVLSVGVLSALYAGYIVPGLRVTCSALSAVVNGAATVLLFVFVDPYLSMLSDDVIAGTVSEAFFQRSVVLLVASRFVGTLVSQVLLVPAAQAIAWIARWL